jgi:hypothetical protein
MDGSKPICYWKGPITDFADPNPGFKWIALVNDPAIGKVDHHYNAGMVSLKLSINHIEKFGKKDFSNI